MIFPDSSRPFIKSIFDSSLVLLLLMVVRTHVRADLLPDILRGDITVELELVASGLGGSVNGVTQSMPTDLVPFPDGSGRLAIATLGGLVRVLDGQGALVASPFLNSTNPKTYTQPTFGMTGFAFHPDYALTGSLGFGKFYTLSTESPGSAPATFSDTVTTGSGLHDAVITEWTDASVVDNVFSGSQRELMRIAEPDGSHNLNDLTFDTAGLLYIPLGDGGFRVDVPTQQSVIFGDNAPDLTKVFGKILRIDPLEPAPGDPQASANGAYRIPAGQALPGALPEIYSYGHRNPYRLNFDRQTGDLYVGEVGQFQIEEVNQVFQGANYGWPAKEGTFLFDRTDGNGVQPDIDVNDNGIGDVAEMNGFIEPVFEYDHTEGVSVTGGFVYRGSAIPQLQGKYIFGDLVASHGIWYGDLTTGLIQKLKFAPGSGGLNQLISIGEDQDGELYAIGRSGGDGQVLRISPAPAPEPSQPKFIQAHPFAAPADGNVYLYIDDLGGAQDSTYVAINTGITITNGNEYEIVAAVGYANGEVLANQSIQAWGTPDGTLGSREFIGQTFSTATSWIDPLEGEWTNNRVSFTADSGQSGEELIILITNYSGDPPGTIGTAYWDNFRVFEEGSLVFQDGFEIGLSPGQEAEVTDAGWDLGNSSLANSGLAAPLLVPGDFNADGIVDGADFLAWQRGQSSSPLSETDLITWQAFFGTPANPIHSAQSKVPEPSAAIVSLLGIAILGLFRKARA
ncbi:PQQ-dependent sugar dehydrogenase [Bythopirellula polymerisocia]|uniref:Soluble aldose sugar dehydrogenase YliI n=1 Tax=Bythopirellula polymerisocia TaxID=2528003 RepID=A0A5C6CF06_9BACT|nr:PQQ-dependent sugar dehydrogenase [Bythopirellula polymerisocia]TWU21389.1 Soluble aldose sugar dehydrogenase YliI precursor [Bythopirellula polymerisocia]